MLESIAQPAINQLRRPDGGFAMLALDQRGSLRDMLLQRGAPAGDESIIAFKYEAIDLLSGYSSAVLLDCQFALRYGPPVLPSTCALIVAADILDQPPGSAVQGSDLDPGITADRVRSLGAVALKLLVLWRPDAGRGYREDLVGRFLSVCGEAEVASVLEGVVRPPAGVDWRSGEERDDAIVAAAGEFSRAGASLYKAEVPGLGGLAPEELVERARQITKSVSSPWVVLSSGVAPAAFPATVEAACVGGADGFLAGRAIWADSVGADDLTAHLGRHATARLETLIASVRSGRGQRVTVPIARSTGREIVNRDAIASPTTRAVI